MRRMRRNEFGTGNRVKRCKGRLSKPGEIEEVGRTCPGQTRHLSLTLSPALRRRGNQRRWAIEQFQRIRNPADWEVGDIADLEVCAAMTDAAGIIALLSGDLGERE